MSDSKWVDRLAALESRVARQHRLVWMVLALEAPRAAGEVLTVRGLVVVDDEGVERVRIGTPLPDPIVNGRRVPRQGVVSGVLIFDAEGDERGGYVTEAHGDAMLTLVQRERDKLRLFVSFVDSRSQAAFVVTACNYYPPTIARPTMLSWADVP